MRVQGEHIEKLRSYGLFVAPPMSATHSFPDGVLVGKPKTIVGNRIPNYSTAFVLDLEKNEEVEFDAPPVWFSDTAEFA